MVLVMKYLYAAIQYVLITDCVYSYGGHEKDKERAISLARQWAPKVWLHSEDIFFPVRVVDYLKEVVPTKVNCSSCRFPTAEIPVGDESSDFFLITKESMGDLLNNKSSIIYGNNPRENNVTLYAFISSCDPSYRRFFIVYWFFYSFNQGRDVCALELGQSRPMLMLSKKCLRKPEIYGNHMGDWEHVSLEIKDSTPNYMFLSVHYSGVIYQYNKASNTFMFSSVTTTGLNKVYNPPSTIYVIDGRPVLFSAKGSHGLWAAPGSYQYTRIRIGLLEDKVDYGPVWDTWRDLQVYLTEDYTPDWYRYQGKWGNPQSDCLPLTFFGINACIFANGPYALCVREPDYIC